MNSALLNIFGVLLLFAVGASAAWAAEEESRKLPVPRFASLATDEVNMRTGPGLRYPIRWVVKRDGLPVEITREFDVWRQVRDASGDLGWVHKSMLSRKRTVLITQGTVEPLRATPEDSARLVARLEPGVQGLLKTCQNLWCKIEVAHYDGWVPRRRLWGVYADESFDK